MVLSMRGGVDRGTVILARCECHFIREHENLVLHPCNDISISMMHPGSTMSLSSIQCLILVEENHTGKLNSNIFVVLYAIIKVYRHGLHIL